MWLYSILMTLLFPFFIVARFFDELRSGNKEWRTRLGCYPKTMDCDLWIHAVSLGEVNSVAPLVDELLKRYTNLRIVVTCNTKTGLNQARHLIISPNASVIAYYLPYDLSFFVRRFIKAFSPRQAIIMEADVWPNILRHCGRNNIPRLLINARITPGSLWKKRLFNFLIPLNKLLDMVCTQTVKDADHFITLGLDANQVKVCGNLKFDIQLAKSWSDGGRQLRVLIGSNRKVWIAASTHEGEETAALSAHHQLLEQYPDSLLILVPRHPRRFSRVAKLCAATKMSFVRLSDHSKEESFCQPYPDFDSLQPADLARRQILLADTMNDLPLLYAAADIAFVGGSLINKGGHNILEPAQLGLPIILGPYTDNLDGIISLFTETGGILKISDPDQLITSLLTAFDLPSAINTKLRTTWLHHQGTKLKLLSYIPI